MTQPKGRPTPKRAAAPRGPVPPPPQTRKEAVKRLREQQAAGRKDVKAGYKANDDARLLPRDQGPVRALVRDVVDARRNVGVLLLPMAVVLVTAQLVGDERVLEIASTIWTGALVAVVLDAVLLAYRVRRTVVERHPEDKKTVRHIGYALLRSTVLRRLRMPPPRVEPGEPV